jgi:lipid II:glycine glycyltransferase (peptidoglycan interpeptide bridge formation enzyme)
MKPASDKQIAQWDQLVGKNPDGGNVLQLKAFAATKARHGWVPQYFMLDKVAVMVLSRRVPQMGEFWYVPKGPGVSGPEGLKAFAERARLLSPQPYAIRIDPEIPLGDVTPQQLAKLGYLQTRNIQYNTSTVIVDLKPTEEEILAGFKQKTRYNIRLALKKGVTVEAVPTDQQAIDKMYQLTQTMTQRANVYLRDKSYFADFWRLHADSGHGQMFFATYEGKVLAGAFVTFIGKKALYKDGGSVRDHAEVQAPYALQWGVMRWLKQQGITEYDLHGTPPAARIDDPVHPLAGLARFKTGFKKEVTEYIGTYDLPLNVGKFRLWRRVGERLAVAYEHRARGRLFY